MSIDPSTTSPSLLDRALKAGAVVSTKHSTHSTASTLHNIEVSSATTYRCERFWSLPSPCEVQASFTKEGLAHKIRKLFSSEIQVGDPLFDDIVFIATNTPQTTRALLGQPGVQEAIADTIRAGGTVSIDRGSLCIQSCHPSRADHLPSEAHEAALLNALIA